MSPKERITPFLIIHKVGDNMIPFLENRALFREYEENMRSYNELVVDNPMYSGQIVAIVNQEVVAATPLQEFDTHTFLLRVRKRADELEARMGSSFIQAPPDGTNHLKLDLKPSPVKIRKTNQDEINEVFFKKRVVPDTAYAGQMVFIADGKIIGSAHIETEEDFIQWEEARTQQARNLGVNRGFVGYAPSVSTSRPLDLCFDLVGRTHETYEV